MKEETTEAQKKQYLNVVGYSDCRAHEVLLASVSKLNIETASRLIERGIESFEPDVCDRTVRPRYVWVRRLDVQRTNQSEDVHHPGGFACHTEHPGGQKWAFRSDSAHPIEVFTLRKNGKYVRQGRALRGSSSGQLADQPHEFYDYNF